ncbi:Hypothetical_protein [Hexamita inflata]|uniref:Hypothetical_protein n=1 Tax=Hexamita inflata TaxID=28002 RepID=A0AA86PGI8_9EUKA|nr:Hypothetical protein HINF_LOCUS25557 [Hexamita inflata]
MPQYLETLETLIIHSSVDIFFVLNYILKQIVVNQGLVFKNQCANKNNASKCSKLNSKQAVPKAVALKINRTQNNFQMHFKLLTSTFSPNSLMESIFAEKTRTNQSSMGLDINDVVSGHVQHYYFIEVQACELRRVEYC